MKKPRKRAVLIGLDGVPYPLIKALVARGTMPRLGSLLSRATFRQMASSVPPVSSVAWSSMMTGTGPGEHGIFGFTELSRGSYELAFPSFADLSAEPFWAALNRRGIRTCVINMPSTYPAPRLDGMLVSGFVSVDFEKSVFPPAILPVLRQMRYEIDVDAGLAHSDLTAFMETALDVFERRMEFCRWAWSRERWACFLFVITETDRIHHFLYPALEDAEHPFHNQVCRFYGQVDAAIGEISDWLSEDDLLVIMSDHGFCSIEREFYVNAWLREHGWLHLKKTPAEDFNDIAPCSSAFALDPCRIYLHREGRYPQGTVRARDERRILDEIKAGLEAWEWRGRRVIKRVFRKDEIYDGPKADFGPDLVALSHNGFDLKASISKEQIEGVSIFAGMHTGDDAFLVARGNTAPIPDSPSVSDVRALLEGAFVLSGETVQ